MTDDGNADVVRMLELDLEYLQRTVDKFDNQRFTIRSWSITTSGALLALAVTAKNVLIPAIGLFVVLFFAYLEVVYMDMQVRVMDRCTKIGKLLQLAMLHSVKTIEEGYTFGIRAAFGSEPFQWSRVRHVVSDRPEIYMFYIGLAVIMSLSALLIWLLR
ncbi:hypothetical protein AB0L41_42145 [Amycolatopsis mediterranei]|uniref:hypothetical protein n=1 Tax=Amycolatopsis mediterranei TaxID=33910 RepID=UPI00342B6BEB